MSARMVPHWWGKKLESVMERTGMEHSHSALVERQISYEDFLMFSDSS